MPKNTPGLQIDIKNWKDRLTNDLDLMLGSIERDAAARLPKYVDGVKTRIASVRTLLVAFFGTAVNLRLSGDLTPDGVQRQINAAGRTVSEQLDAIRKETVDKLESRLAEKRAALRRAELKDPMERLLRLTREQEIRSNFQSFDRMDGETRLRQAVALDASRGTELIEALASAPFSLVRTELLDELRSAIAEKDPELRDLVQLQQLYSQILGTARQSLIAAAGGDAVALDTRTPSVDTRKPFTVSGAEVPEVLQ